MRKPIKLVLITLSVIALSYVVAVKISNNTEKTFAILNERIQQTFKDGDIIFQTSQSEQCEAVRIATDSKFSHCGIIFNENGKC